MSHARNWGALAILAILAPAAAAQSPAAKPNALTAFGQFPLAKESSLVIRGVPGQIVITTKPARELRYASRAKDKSGGDRPLAVSFTETTITLAPPPGVTLPDGILRLEAPPSFSVRVESPGGTVLVDGFAGAVAISGKGTVTTAQALTGTLEADLEGGSLKLSDIGGAVTARISAGCKMSASDLKGGIDLNSQDATFKVGGVAGSCRLDAHGGSGELFGLASGGDLRLSECTLQLDGAKGELTVTSDAAVQFANMAASMRFDMDGGTLHGKGNQGRVEVRARRTEVNLEAIVGAVRVEGEGLTTKLVGLTGEAHVDVTGGNFVLQRMLGPVDAVVYSGDAHLIELQGAVRLDIQGGNAEVSWASVTGESDSRLQNTSGDITARFPGNASCRVTAKSQSGHVVSDLPAIKAPANATEAQGALGQGQVLRPLIEIEAEGNIHLTSAVRAPGPPS